MCKRCVQMQIGIERDQQTYIALAFFAGISTINFKNLFLFRLP